MANNLTCNDVVTSDRELAFPESVVELFEGRLGQPVGGFPAALQKRILRGREPLHDRPGALLPPADLAAVRTELEGKIQRPPSDRDVLTYLLYPRVYPEFDAHVHMYSDVSVLPTPVFFHGMEPGQVKRRHRAREDADHHISYGGGCCIPVEPGWYSSS